MTRRSNPSPVAARAYAELMSGATQVRADVEITLPWPPSANHYWRHVGEMVLISKDGREYRRRVAKHVLVARAAGRFTAQQRLDVSIVASPPDNRRRDLDNLLKSLLDAIEAAGVIPDDSQIDLLMIQRGCVSGQGEVAVSVREVDPLPQVQDE